MTGTDIGYQMRLDPKHTKPDSIRRLSSHEVPDIDKLYRSKSIISLTSPPDTSFRVKGQSLTTEEEKRELLSNAQKTASVLSLKSESASPHVFSARSSTRKGRKKSELNLKDIQPKYNDGKKLFENNIPTKTKTKLPEIKVNEKSTENNMKRSVEKPTDQSAVPSKSMGSWSLSYINPSLLEIDMSGFAPFGEYGYFSAYGVKGHQAYTTSDKLSSYAGSSLNSLKKFKINLQMKNKLYQSGQGLYNDSMTAGSSLSRSNLLSHMTRSKTMDEIKAEQRIFKKTSTDKSKRKTPVSARQKVPKISDNLNLTRSKTCLVLPEDSPRGVFSKRKRGSKEMTSSKGIRGSRESLASIPEGDFTKPKMKTISTQTKGDDTSISDYLKEINANSARDTIHSQGGILYSSLCFDSPLGYNDQIKGLNPSRPLNSITPKDTTPRTRHDDVIDDAESVISDDNAPFQMEISIARNTNDHSTG